jgi:hypothetical protein
MKIDKDTQFALGKTLRALDEADGAYDGKIDGAGIARVEVDGKVVDAKEAIEAFEAQVRSDAERAWAFMDTLEAKADKLEKRLESSRVGQSKVGELFHKALDVDPERVSHQAQLVVTLDNGQKIELPFDVVHRSISAFLQRASMTMELIALAPLIGNLIAGGTAFVSALASLAARAGRQPELAKALQGMAGKHIALAGAGFVPVLGSAAPVIAAVTDYRDVRAMKRPHVDAAAVASLGT